MIFISPISFLYSIYFIYFFPVPVLAAAPDNSTKLFLYFFWLFLLLCGFLITLYITFYLDPSYPPLCTYYIQYLLQSTVLIYEDHYTLFYLSRRYHHSPPPYFCFWRGGFNIYITHLILLYYLLYTFPLNYLSSLQLQTILHFNIY